MIICHDDFLVDISQSSRDRSYANRFLILTLLISCLLHFLVLLAFPEWRLWKPVASSVNPSLQISLRHLVTKKIEQEPAHQSAKKPVETIITKPEKNISNTTEIVNTQNNSAVIAPQKINLLTSDELNDISINKDTHYSDDSLAFNPRLKENRTITRAMPKGGAQEQQLEVWQDIHGNRFYKSGGQCYKATSEAKGISSVDKGTNWYFVSCGGKSESEKMTDRINQEMKQRFRQ